ncbi:hypothetical protein FG386_001800 [Cryptosporidium ryanae]|uniref:uncharacterized protein n=1 Tax=Cryptosporidium ryanae TaxID=515981 RepID=UPI00351A5B01|nr:hypothetical protein FG386_001800 [Cryptosporidium ryanae]
MLNFLSEVCLSKWSKYITNDGSNPGYPFLFRGDSPSIWINKLREAFTKYGGNSFWSPIFDVYGKSLLIALMLKLLFLLSCSLCSYIFGIVVSNKQGVVGSCVLIVFSYLLKSVLDAHNRLYISRLTIRIESGLTGVIFHRLLSSHRQNNIQSLSTIEERAHDTFENTSKKGSVKLEIQFTPQNCSGSENLNPTSGFGHNQESSYNDGSSAGCDYTYCNDISLKNKGSDELNTEDNEDGNSEVLQGCKRSLRYLLSDPDVFSMLVGDITSVQFFLNSIIDIMLLPISVFLTWMLLKKQVGFMAALPGIATFMLLLLTSFGFQIVGTIYKAPFMENRDKRLSLCHDILGALRLIRIMGAEDLAYSKLVQNRVTETHYNKKRLIRTQLGSFLEYHTQKTTQLIVFVLFYAFSSESLNIASILTSIHILHSFSSPIRGVPVTFIEGLISLLRIKTFISSHSDDYTFRCNTNEDETSTNCDFNNLNIRDDKVFDFFAERNGGIEETDEHLSNYNKIQICREERENCTDFELVRGRKEKERTFVVKSHGRQAVLSDSMGFGYAESDTNGVTGHLTESQRIIYNYLECDKDTSANSKGRCVIITGGSHGCGKTSIINSILDQKHDDSCYAYTNHNSIWLPQGTVRSSILFGKEWDEDLYERVVTVCQLKDDFSSWKDGDLRVIDEGGYSLSGGQKTRVSLARCLYYINEASLFLFDDIFLNLDPNVSIKIFSNLFSENGFLVGSNVILTIDLTSLLYFMNNTNMGGRDWSCMYIVHLNNHNVFFSGPVYDYVSMINRVKGRFNLNEKDRFEERDECESKHAEDLSRMRSLDFGISPESRGSCDLRQNKSCIELNRGEGDGCNSSITSCSDHSQDVYVDGQCGSDFVHCNPFGCSLSRRKSKSCTFDESSYDFGEDNFKLTGKPFSFSHSYSYSSLFNADANGGRKRNLSLEDSVSRLIGMVKRRRINRRKKTSNDIESRKNSAGVRYNSQDERENTGELEIIQHINSHISTISSKNLSIESFHSLICATPKSSYASMSYSNGSNANNSSGRSGKPSFNNGKTTFIKSSEVAQAENLPSDLVAETEIMERITGVLGNTHLEEEDGDRCRSGGKNSAGKTSEENLDGANKRNSVVHEADGSAISFFSKFGLKYLFGYYYISKLGIACSNKKVFKHDQDGAVYVIDAFGVGKKSHFDAHFCVSDQPSYIPSSVMGGDGYSSVNGIASAIRDGTKIYMWYLELIGKRWCIFLLLSCILKSILDRYSDAYISGVEGGNSNSYFIIVYALIVTAQGLLGSFLFVGEAIGGLRASNKAHDQLLEIVFHSPFRFYDSTPVQYLMNRLSTDILVMDELPLKKIASVIVPSVDYIIQIIMLTYIVPLSLPVTLVVIITTYKAVCTSYITTNVRAQKTALSVLSPMYGLFSQIINGIVTIYAFNAQKHMMNQFYMQIEHLQRIRLLQHISSQWAAIRLQVYTIPLVVFIVLFPIQENNLRYLALLYSLFISDTTGIITYKYSSMERDMCSGERIYQLVSKINDSAFRSNNTHISGFSSFKYAKGGNNCLASAGLSVGGKRDFGPAYRSIPDQKEANLECGGKSEFGGRTGLVIADLDVGYYDVKGILYNSILSEINVNVGPSQHIGVVGRTGSGKSTLVLALLGLIEYRKGQITLDNLPISSLSVRERKEMIGILPQTPLVLKDWTLRDFLDPYNEFSDSEIYNGIDRCFIDGSKKSQGTDLCLSVNLLSESQLRFYSIARLVINSKKYRMILIDEPPPSLSGNFGLQNNINLIVSTHFKHCNVFIIAHHVDSIKYCNCVWILAKRKIANIIHPSLIPTQLDLAQILTDYERQ